jgi:hypothetical protein
MQALTNFVQGGGVDNEQVRTAILRFEEARELHGFAFTHINRAALLSSCQAHQQLVVADMKQALSLISTEVESTYTRTALLAIGSIKQAAANAAAATTASTTTDHAVVFGLSCNLSKVEHRFTHCYAQHHFDEDKIELPPIACPAPE